MRNLNSFSVLIWANKGKADIQEMIPLYARVTVMEKRAEIALKKKVNPRKWDVKSGFMKGVVQMFVSSTITLIRILQDSSVYIVKLC